MGEVWDSGAYISKKSFVNIMKIGHKQNQGLKGLKLYIYPWDMVSVMVLMINRKLFVPTVNDQ